MFQKATRTQSKLRLNVSGPSGSGKTMGALTLASSIKGDGRIALIDTENGSASLYANQFDFDVLNLEPPFTPVRFAEAIAAAEQASYSVIVIDSATHEWFGAGGCLEMNDRTAKAKFKGNTWSAWSDTNKEHQKFINAIVQSKKHIICTTRSKTETAQEGKKIVRLGTKLEQRDGFEYEFTVALDLVHDGHYATAIKDRTGLFMGKQDPITQESGASLLEWLNDGTSQKEVVESYIKDIEQAESVQQLEDAFMAGYKAVSAFGDMDYLASIVSAKDAKKASFQETLPTNTEAQDKAA